MDTIDFKDPKFTQCKITKAGNGWYVDSYMEDRMVFTEWEKLVTYITQHLCPKSPSSSP